MDDQVHNLVRREVIDVRHGGPGLAAVVGRAQQIGERERLAFGGQLEPGREDNVPWVRPLVDAPYIQVVGKAGGHGLPGPPAVPRDVQLTVQVRLGKRVQHDVRVDRIPGRDDVGHVNKVGRNLPVRQVRRGHQGPQSVHRGRDVDPLERVGARARRGPRDVGRRLGPAFGARRDIELAIRSVDAPAGLIDAVDLAAALVIVVRSAPTGEKRPVFGKGERVHLAHLGRGDELPA